MTAGTNQFGKSMVPVPTVDRLRYLGELAVVAMAATRANGAAFARFTESHAAQREFYKAIGEVVQADATRRGLLLWALFHHQGTNSPVGQPIRRALGIGQYDELTPEHIAEAHAAATAAMLSTVHPTVIA